MISVSNLSKTFTTKKSPPGFWGFTKPKIIKNFEAVKNLSLQIKAGEFVALLGPNGAGKTTTLKMLTGILYPTKGDVKVAGFTPWKKQNEFKKSISFVMAQKSQLFLELPVKDTFEFLAEIYNVDKTKTRKLLSDLVERFDLGDKLEILGRRLSLGQRMKAELICCFLYEPKVIFLDEPTIGLDVNSAFEVRKFLKESNQLLGTTIILTTHNMEDVEELCPRTIVINKGEKVYDDATHKLKKMFGDEQQLEFITDRIIQYPNIPEILHHSQNETSLKLTCQRSNSAKVISHVMAHASVLEINIAEKDLSKVIAQLYNQ